MGASGLASRLWAQALESAWPRCQRWLMLSGGFIAAVASFNGYRLDVDLIPLLHLSLPVLGVFLQPVCIFITKSKNICSRVKISWVF